MHSKPVLPESTAISLKLRLKSLLHYLHLLEAMRGFNYWLTQFDKKTTHPRRLTVRFYSQFICKGELCFDIGANIGQRTKIFLELGARVICVEPQSSCLQALHSTFDDKDTVVIIGNAVSDQEGLKQIKICDELSTISSMSERWQTESIHAKRLGYQWTQTETVHTTTLDDLISKFGTPKFCKIDVEGFEEKVLKGLSSPIPFISFEFNAVFFEEVEKCTERLLTIGNYSFNFASGEPSNGKGLLLEQWIDSNELLITLKKLSLEDDEFWGDIYARLTNY